MLYPATNNTEWHIMICKEDKWFSYRVVSLWPKRMVAFMYCTHPQYNHSHCALLRYVTPLANSKAVHFENKPYPDNTLRKSHKRVIHFEQAIMQTEYFEHPYTENKTIWSSHVRTKLFGQARNGHNTLNKPLNGQNTMNKPCTDKTLWTSYKESTSITLWANDIRTKHTEQAIYGQNNLNKP